MADDGLPSHRTRLRVPVEEASEEALDQALERNSDRALQKGEGEI